MTEERLQKTLARAGIASRRHSEALIRAGRVSVNSRVVSKPGAKVNPARDRILVDGKPIRAEKPVYLALYKPRGYVTTTSDPQNRRKVADLIGRRLPQRVYPVGRLDYDSEGLLLFTNDGDLAYALTHPKFGVPKTYQAQVKGRPGVGTIDRLRKGIVLDDGPTAPAGVRVMRGSDEKTLVKMVLYEGRNRLIRRMWEAVGHPVIRLKRTKIGGVALRGLRPGAFRMLTAGEVDGLRRLIQKRES